MLEHDQLTPEEIQEQNQYLIQDLGHYYDTRAEDSASLARIRARLLQRAQGPLPIVDDGEITPSSRFSQVRRERNTNMNFVHMLAWDSALHPLRNTLVAAVLLFVLIGSFVLAVQVRHGTGAMPETPPIVRGWSLLAKFNGTGSQTITGKNIAVGQRYGWVVTCTNIQNDLVSVDINGKFSSGGGCAGIPTVPLQPEFSRTSPVAMAPIHTIKVTAPASTAWEFLLLKGTYYPPLDIDAANWHALRQEVEGIGESAVPTDFVILPKTWALQFLCHGTGDITIDLQSEQPPYNLSTITSVKTLCNGQVKFDVYDAVAQGKGVSQLQVTTDANNDWQVVLLGCANGKPRCGVTDATPGARP